MIEFIRLHQLDMMLGLSSICFITALFAILNTALPKQRKWALVYVELAAACLLFFDRMAYLYRGDMSQLGYWMVRISNFLDFTAMLCVAHGINLYVSDVCRNDLKLERVPLRLKINEIMACAGWMMIILTQFTGLYYYIDENNQYQRSSLFWISYIPPITMLISQLSVVIKFRKSIKKIVWTSLLIFTTVPIVASIIQFFAYGISVADIAIVGAAMILYIFAIIDMNEQVENANKIKIDYLKEEQKALEHLFEQTTGLLASIIDAKEEDLKGRSKRIADYAKEIAIRSGKSPKDCDEIYYAALLHDIGKLVIDDEIINKGSDLTEEEESQLRYHADIGGDLLSAISEYPYLSIGARYHHEKYDGSGYPRGLRGKAIPEAARIIAIADAYEEMTSKNPHRDPLPQGTVREQFMTGAGTIYDPDYAQIMIDMIDNDTEYRMRQLQEENNDERINLAEASEMHFDEYKERVTDGIKLSETATVVHFDAKADEGFDADKCVPAIILFDSYDGCVHTDDRNIRVLNYVEYGEIWLDGHFVSASARNMQLEELSPDVEDGALEASGQGIIKYEIEAVKYKDHVRIDISSTGKKLRMIAALPSLGSEAYIGFTGEHCHIININVDAKDIHVDENTIPRIAEEISYINRLEGDIPNLQIDGNCSAYTQPVPVVDGMRVIFHTMSLPTANLIWNCPSIVVYTSEDEEIHGEGYGELVNIRLDGENTTENSMAENDLQVKKASDFEGWDAWKKFNKEGFECQLDFRRSRNKITLLTENGGISIKNTSTVPENVKAIYVALTGNQCTITDIRVM